MPEKQKIYEHLFKELNEGLENTAENRKALRGRFTRTLVLEHDVEPLVAVSVFDKLIKNAGLNLSADGKKTALVELLKEFDLTDPESYEKAVEKVSFELDYAISTAANHVRTYAKDAGIITPTASLDISTSDVVAVIIAGGDSRDDTIKGIVALGYKEATARTIYGHKAYMVEYARQLSAQQAWHPADAEDAEDAADTDTVRKSRTRK